MKGRKAENNDLYLSPGYDENVPPSYGIFKYQNPHLGLLNKTEQTSTREELS